MSNGYDPYVPPPEHGGAQGCCSGAQSQPGPQYQQYQGQPYQPQGYQGAPQPGQPYQNQPYQGQQYGAPARRAGSAPYGSWGSRVGAYLIDSLLSAVPMIVISGLGLWLAFKDSYSVEDINGNSTLHNVSGGGVALALLGPLVALLFNLWNRAIRQGRTGQSLGKKMLHLKVVDERTGQPTGAGVGFGRYLLEAVAGGISGGLLLIVDLLWPLWDDTKQTLHDKIVHTIVVRGD